MRKGIVLLAYIMSLPPEGISEEKVGVLGFVHSSGAEETRTPDFLRAREALSQLSYSPIVVSHYTNKDSYPQLLENLRNI